VKNENAPCDVWTAKGPEEFSKTMRNKGTSEKRKKYLVLCQKHYQTLMNFTILFQTQTWLQL
jgi:hypothetical protein